MVEDEYELGFLRPDDPDFWTLSQLILQLTGRLEEEKDPEQVLMSEIVDYVDDYTISYTALQRAMRYVLEEGTVEELQEKQSIVNEFAAIWLEGFLLGARFHETKEENDEES